MSGSNVDRRDFLKCIAASGTVAALPGVAAESLANTPAPQTYSILTPRQSALVESVVDRLIPPDDYPGGKEAGAAHFIDQKLAGRYGRFYLGRYEAGLKRIDAISEEQAGKIFVELSLAQQSRVLEAFASQEEDRDFFNLLLGDAFEGYYGNPAHGGNRNGASWKMIGFGG